MDEEVAARFRRRYGATDRSVAVTVERETFGTDYGANGFTDLAQADEIGLLLELSPGDRLLDLGAGCGWPGLHLAATTGCTVVSIDPEAAGVAAGLARCNADGLDARHLGVVADGVGLPVRDGAMDAVVHIDVLC